MGVVRILHSFLFYVQEKGWSAIFFAAEKADVQMAQLLCEAAANLDLRDKVFPLLVSICMC